ncbi:OprO/OprP family phosphate-selective porin [Caulobacter endophyticus]|uniref:OprO/OprP family phosphate-selective porin n=1 Tax=Caulobacter endophyticus TaxID=2172652 RepID=UPI002410AE67|nr:porin [Caulobacter endophyticus]MDG2528867.1 porin [Caulobacter endophyticus]
MSISTSLCARSALGAFLALGLGVAAQAQDMGVKWSGAPQFSNDDVAFKVRGRILLDAVFQDVQRDGPGGDFKTRNVRGRQAFLGIEGKLNNYFAYKAEGGAVNGGAWTWDDVVIEYKPNEPISLLFGNIKATGLENLTSTRFITFLDRGPYGDFGVDSYLLGVVAKYQGLNYSLTGAVQGAPINTVDLANANADSKERITLTTRAHWAPVNGDLDKLHLALSYRYRNRGDEGAFVYSGRTNTAYSNATFYTTGGIGNRDNTLAFEGAYVHGPFSVQGEYASIDVTRQGGAAVGGDPKIKVGYAYVTFWPTGELRNYDAMAGEFKRPKILNPVTAGGWGGVELALRYDVADTTEAYETLKTKPAASQAGEYKGVTLGVNYYPTGYVRFQANYTDGDVDNFGANQDYGIKQFQLRAQLDF